MKLTRVLAFATTVALALTTLTGGMAVAQGAEPEVATAVMYDADGVEVGLVTWTAADAVVTVDATVAGLPAGFHGFHVHAVGECVAPFTSAGGHLESLDTDHPGHAGDMPVLLVNADGTGTASFVTDRYAVADLVGAALIIHANPDNYANIPERYLAPEPTPVASASPAPSVEPVLVSGPDAATLATGDAGPRIACGVIA